MLGLSDSDTVNKEAFTNLGIFELTFGQFDDADLGTVAQVFHTLQGFEMVVVELDRFQAEGHSGGSG